MKYYVTVLKKYVDFNGRARRSEYWYFVLFNIIFAFAFSFIDVALGTVFLYPIYALFVFIPGIAVLVRRMHDVDKSGWYCLIPIYNLVLACTEGTPGGNQYGPDPKRPELMDEIDIIGANPQ